MWRALVDIGEQLLADDEVRVVVLRADGNSFSAGLDRAMFTTGVDGELGMIGIAVLDDAALDATIDGFQQAFAWWRDDRIVSIAAVQGHAVGAGFQLALACDLRVLGDDAQLSMKETTLGLVPDLGGTKPLVDLVGYSRALEICTTGRWVGAAEAAAAGLASLVVPSAELEAAARDLAAAVLAAPPAAVRATKALLQDAGGRRYDDQRAAERAAQAGAAALTWRREPEVDLALNDEQRAVRAAVREWVDEVVIPHALSNDRKERFPQEALEGLVATGFVGMSIPEEYGGGGADPLTYCLFIEELSRGDANVRSIMSVHLGLVAGSIARWGTEEQKQEWLPRMATGEVLGCFGLTEPDHGSNPADLRATAEPLPGGGWRISGRKVFITNGSIARSRW